MKILLHNLILTILIWDNRGKVPRFKQWLELESYKEKILEAVENRQPDFPKYMVAYLSTAFRVSSRWYDHADWTKVVAAFYQALSQSPIIKLPITSPTNEHSKSDEAWSYDGRMWHLYSHMLAKTYGWTLEYISQLRVSDALATIQEIITDDQLEREFYYGLSEVAYVYDKNSKTSKFKPLPRPSWMRPRVQPEKIKKFKIPASMIPMGNVITDALPEEYLPK